MPNLLSEEWQRVTKIKGFFEHPGWEIFETHLNELLELEKFKIEQVTSDRLNDEKLKELNFHIAKRNTLSRVLLIKEELLEEVNSSMDDVNSIT